MSQGTDVLNAYGDLNGQNNAGRRGGCGKNREGAAQMVVSGVVTEVRADSFDVKAEDGAVYTVGVAPCTQLNANKANYKMISGHKAIAKGWRAAAKGKKIAMDGGQITCL